MDNRISRGICKEDSLDAIEQQRDKFSNEEEEAKESIVEEIEQASPDHQSNELCANFIANNVESDEDTVSSAVPSATVINQDAKKAILAERSSAARCVRRRPGCVTSSLTSSTASSNTKSTELPRRRSDLEETPNRLLEEKIGIAIRSSLNNGQAGHSPSDVPTSDNDKKTIDTGEVDDEGDDVKLRTQAGDVAMPGAFAVSSGEHNSFHNSFASIKSTDSKIDQADLLQVTDQDERTTETENEASSRALPKALVVDSDTQEDSYLPAALEFDPDAKDGRMKQSRRKIVCIISWTTALACLFTGTFVAYWSEIRVPRDILLRDALFQQLGELNYTGGHGYQEALEWLSFHDGRQLNPDDESLSQRFLLAALYFSTQPPNGTWKYCAANDEEQSNLCMNPWKIEGLRWPSNESECLWNGVSCVDGQVSSIILDQYGLHGKFPHAIAKLQSLVTIGLSDNELSGPIPTILFSSYIETIGMARNKLSGTLESLTNSTNLRFFDASYNRLSGPLIVPERSTLLYFFSLSGNKLTGAIPYSLMDMENLELIDIGNNILTGTIPDKFERLRHLKKLKLERNNLSGSIPDSLFDCKELIHVDMSSNKVRGTLSSELFQLQNLQNLFLQGNSFTGTLPTSSNLLKALAAMSVSGNNFTGTFPKIFCSSPVLTFVDSDCQFDAKDRAPEIVCECCTVCCDRDGTDCFSQNNV